MVLSLLAVILVGSVGYADATIDDYQVKILREKTLDVSGHAMSGTQVFMKIFDSKDNIVFEEYRWANEDEGLFVFDVSVNKLGFGDYSGEIIHEETIQPFKFSFKPKVDPTINASQKSSSITSQHDQDIERLQLEIQKRDNQITELKNQVFDLEKQLDNLQQIVNEQIKVIMDTLVSLKN